VSELYVLSKCEQRKAPTKMSTRRNHVERYGNWARLLLSRLSNHFQAQKACNHTLTSLTLHSYPWYSKLCLGMALLCARACSLSLSLANGFDLNTGGPGEFSPPIIMRGLKGGESVVRDDPLFFKTAAAIVKTWSSRMQKGAAPRVFE